MKRAAWALGVVVLGLQVAGPAIGQEFVIFPAKGQSDQQLEQDKFACYEWAKKESGFDPMAVPTATSAPPPNSDASVAGGAAKGGIGGGLLGAGIGAIAGGGRGAAQGALIGILSGGFLGGLKSSFEKKQDEQSQQQWANDQTSQYVQKRSGYNRAYSACLEAKGYVVK